MPKVKYREVTLPNTYYDVTYISKGYQKTAKIVDCVCKERKGQKIAQVYETTLGEHDCIWYNEFQYNPDREFLDVHTYVERTWKEWKECYTPGTIKEYIQVIYTHRCGKEYDTPYIAVKGTEKGFQYFNIDCAPYFVTADSDFKWNSSKRVDYLLYKEKRDEKHRGYYHKWEELKKNGKKTQKDS